MQRHAEVCVSIARPPAAATATRATWQPTPRQRSDCRSATHGMQHHTGRARRINAAVVRLHPAQRTNGKRRLWRVARRRGRRLRKRAARAFRLDRPRRLRCVRVCRRERFARQLRRRAWTQKQLLGQQGRILKKRGECGKVEMNSAVGATHRIKRTIARRMR